jgi:hypothetical protein
MHITGVAPIDSILIWMTITWEREQLSSNGLQIRIPRLKLEMLIYIKKDLFQIYIVLLTENSLGL